MDLKHLSYSIAKTYSSIRSSLLKKLAPYDEAVQMAAEYARRCMIKLTCVHSYSSLNSVEPAYKNVTARIQPLVTAHDV